MGLSYSPKQGVSEAYQLAEQEEKPEWLLQALAGASTAAFLAIQADVRQFVAHIIEED
jgi:hypothetical protein